MPGTIRRNQSISDIAPRVIFFTGLLLVAPLLFYPRQLGFPAFDLNPAVSLFEWGFYVAVLSMATSQLAFSTRVVAAGFTVVFRLAIGALTGVLVSLAHGQPLSAAVAHMMWSYPLALIPQVLASPIVLSRLWEQLFALPARPTRHVKTPGPPRVVIGGSRSSVSGRPASATASRMASATSIKPHEPSYDDAVSYVGEYSGVRMCWIVDCDGLPVAVWQRQQYTGDADFWAPVSLEMVEFHRRRLSVNGTHVQPLRLDLHTVQGRVIVEGCRDFWLGVLTDPEADELVSVRIARAREMINRQMTEVGGRVAAAGEVQYV